MKIVYKADIVMSVPAAWAEQYKYCANDDDKRQITEKLKALEWPFTADHVNAIIGNNSWTDCICDECGNDFPSLVRIGDEPDYEAHWLDLCKTCLQKAVEL